MEIKLREKLLKLLELSKRGVDGEKVNAEYFLNQLLKKHGFTIDDIEEVTKRDRGYPYTSTLNHQLIIQICTQVLNSSEVFDIKVKKMVAASVTDCEHVQILELIDFHLDNFKEEKDGIVKDLLRAYIQKHRIFRSDDEDAPKPTPEELRAEERTLELMDNLSDKMYTKKLESWKQ